MVHQNFTLGLYITKMDSANQQVFSFNGDVTFSTSGNISGLSPTTKTMNNYSVTWSGTEAFSVNSSTLDGKGTITATVHDNVDPVDDCTCEVDITVLQGIGVYCDYIAQQSDKEYIVSLLNDEPGLSQNFILMDNLSNIEYYDGVIIDFAGQNKNPPRSGGYGSALSDPDADKIKEYAKTKPVIIAHDYMTEYAVNNMVNGIFGIDFSNVVEFNPEESTFSCTGHSICSGIPIEQYQSGYQETTSDSFNSAGWGTAVMTVNGNNAIIVDASGANHALIGEAIYHPFGQSDEQWWDTSKQLMINLINWVFP